MNDSNPTLKKAKKLLKKIAKKLGNKDLRCVVQISTDTDHNDDYLTYTAMIASPKEGVAPVTFAAFTKKEFIEKIESFYKGETTTEELEIAYLEGKKIAAENTIKFVDEQLDTLKNHQPEEPVEAEIVQED